MPGLSNSTPNDAKSNAQAKSKVKSAGETRPVTCRPAVRSEIEPALRLILASADGLATDEQVLDFLAFCKERSINTNLFWVAMLEGKIVWAILPVVSPGKTVLLFSPAVEFSQTPPAAVGELAGAVCDAFAAEGVHLAQMLIDPASQKVIQYYRRAGFDLLAELIYLQRPLRRRETPPTFVLPAGLRLETYSQKTHADLSAVIQRSYEKSLDCPALNGLREMDDVIASHKATGEFDPSLWWIAYQNDDPVAALLLSRLPQTNAIELVYLGIAPEARGQGLGDLLMKLALATAIAEQRKYLSLAVDSINEPALNLYYRFGLRRVGSRQALIRKCP